VPFVATERFRDRYRRLDPVIQARADKALELLLSNPRHPSLGVKRYKRYPGVWEARVTQSYRILFLWDGQTITGLSVGPHDIL
jgi:mRNA-degrading endonuclease RelE of RelBE toxin-antitoxin system